MTLVTKNTTNNAMYSYKNHTYNNSMELYIKSHYKSFHFHQYFHCILLLIRQLSFFYIYNFFKLSILLCHMIYHIHNYNY